MDIVTFALCKKMTQNGVSSDEVQKQIDEIKNSISWGYTFFPFFLKQIELSFLVNSHIEFMYLVFPNITPPI